MPRTNQAATETVARWTEAASALVGRKIVSVRYTTAGEAAHCGWDSRAIVLVLDDGNSLFPSRDDEGNDAGALFTTYRALPCLPVIR